MQLTNKPGVVVPLINKIISVKTQNAVDINIVLCIVLTILFCVLDFSGKPFFDLIINTTIIVTEKAIIKYDIGNEFMKI